MYELQQATSQDQHLQHLKDKIPQNIRTYWTFRDDKAVNDGVIIKGRCIVVSET